MCTNYQIVIHKYLNMNRGSLDERLLAMEIQNHAVLTAVYSLWTPCRMLPRPFSVSLDVLPVAKSSLIFHCDVFCKVWVKVYQRTKIK